MRRHTALTIAGQRIRLGETRDLLLPFGESYMGKPMSVPVHVIRAKKQGPRVLLTGAMHGDELNGMGIIRHLLYEQLSGLIRGSLVCVPVLNVYGFESHSRYLPDRRDLNRSFPGSSAGSLTARLAALFFEQVVSQCDYAVDFHSAAVRRTNYPNVRADMRKPEVRILARAFGSELIVNSKGPRGSLRQACVRAGIPSIIIEAGEVMKVEPSVLELGVKGALNILKHLGMLRGKPEPPVFQTVVEKTTWVRAEHGGFLVFHAKPGDFVQEGDDLATNYNIHGRERRLISSPVDGIVLGMTTMPAVKPGEPVYHIALRSRRTLARLRKKVAQLSRDRYTRIQRDLATSVAIQERG